MSSPSELPRILVIDDLFGRSVAKGKNFERRGLCAQYLLLDKTADEDAAESLKVKQPIAEAIFCRGQTPARATVGDTVRNDLEGTLEVVAKGSLEAGNRPWALILLDLCFYTGRVTSASDGSAPGMPEGSPGDDRPASYFGLTLLSEINERFPGLPVAILSNQSRDAVSREFALRGAVAFLPRTGPAAQEHFRELLWKYGLIGDPRGQIVGESIPLLRALRTARQAAQSRRNLLVRGERGSGKELLANYIHSQSRIEGPYVVVDSGALSPPLYASELFGHRRGAFTGADSARTGKIVLADGGDLFLDEIGNMPMDVQAGLLRVLDQREVMPLGATTGLKVDVRYLSATNEDLESKRARGTFRDDLYDRLCDGGTVTLPPLRQRREDIPLLVQKFLVDADAQLRLERPHMLEPSAIDALQNYDWPGNIRELQSLVYATVRRYADIEHLFPSHFPLPSSSDRVAAGVSDETPSPAILKVEPWPSLIEALNQIKVRETPPAAISRTYNEIEEGLYRARAALLRGALEATRRRTPACPEGEILIHPAVKLLLGSSSLSASKAADIIKRILTASENLGETVSADALLSVALDRAVRLRPGLPKRKSINGKE